MLLSSQYNMQQHLDQCRVVITRYHLQVCLEFNIIYFTTPKEPLQVEKADSDKCPLWSKVQSLLHVLNNFSVALRSTKSLWHQAQHYLARVKSAIKSHRKDICLIADQPKCDYRQPEFLVSDLKPDMISWSVTDNTCYLIELTVCFDTIPDRAEVRKSLHSSTAYKCTIIILQVGSRGLTDLDSFESLRSYLKIKQAAYRFSLLKEITTDTIIGSLRIWSQRKCSSQVSLL